MIVGGTEDLMLVSKKGSGIRMKCSDISTIGRATQGVRVIRLAEGDSLAAAAIIFVDEEGNGSNGERHDDSEDSTAASENDVVKSDVEEEPNKSE